MGSFLLIILVPAGLEKAADAMVELCVLLGLCLNIYVVGIIFDTSFYRKVKLLLPVSQVFLRALQMQMLFLSLSRK
jgi:hypothetical protein